MSIETYNRLRNVQSIPVQHNYAIMGGRNEDFIRYVLNVKKFMNKPHYIQTTKTKTTTP